MQAINPIYHHTDEMLQQEQNWIVMAKEDPAFFAPLYKKYHDQIFRYVYQRMDDEQLAYDVTSQVFFKAIKNIKRFEFRGLPLAAWLFRIAKSELNQSFRDRLAVRTISITDAHMASFMEVFEETSNEINKQKLSKALLQLTREDLQLIEMRFFENRRYKEIGEILELTENNAKVKTFRALNRLRSFFNKS